MTAAATGRRRQDRSRSRGRDRPSSDSDSPPSTPPPTPSHSDTTQPSPQSTPQSTPRSPSPTPSSESFCDVDMIGVKVRKKFGSEWYDGEVISVSRPGIFKVKYEDSDTEELDKFELFEHELAYEQHYLFY